MVVLYRSRFANYILPYNFAFGVAGGINMIVNTMRLGVQRYITDPDTFDPETFPSRALVSLDIKNMFNAVSRQKLREIIRI